MSPTSTSRNPRARALWLFEHAARELDVACAVKCLAESRYDVDISIKNIYLDAREILMGPEPRVVIYPFFYFADGALGTHHYVRAWPRALHFNLAWEELFYAANAQIKGPSDDFARHRVLHHAWGSFYRDFLVSHGVPKENVFVNGNPAYQLYKPPYSGIAPTRGELAARHSLDPATSWLFIPENYRWAFFTEHKLRKLSVSEEHLAQLIEMKDHCERSLELLIQWCQNLALEGDVSILLRPRPATNTQRMLELVRKIVGEPRGNFRVSKAGTVREWILSSDVVVSSFSTSLVEAAVAEKPIYMFEPLPLPKGLQAAWYQHVDRVTSETELRAASRVQAGSGSWAALGAWAHAELLAAGDPIERLAQMVGRLIDPQQNVAPSPGTAASWLKRLSERRASRKARQEGAQSIQMNRETHERDDLEGAAIQDRVAKWRRVLGLERGPLLTN